MRKSLLLIIICILLLAGCERQRDAASDGIDMDAMVFQRESVELIESENGIGAVFGMTKDMEVAQYEGITYGFEPGISLEEREKCILATKAILDRIGTGQSIRINIFATASYAHTFINEAVVYTHVQDWQSVDYTCAVLYGLFGEYCNYGMLYGYANFLRSEIYGTPMDVLTGAWGYDGNPDALDLTLPCFRNEFVDETNVASCGLIANTFVKKYIANKGEYGFLILLRNSGNVENVDLFVETLSQFYAEKGIDHRPTDVLYRLGGKSYDYIVKCPYAVIYVEKDWFDANKDLCPYTYDNFLHVNYSDVRQFFTVNIAQMKQYQDLFALDSYNNDLDIFFTNHSGVKYSYYNGLFHVAGIYNTASFMHEYIHALTFGSNIQEAWAGEGFARYYSYRYDYYGNAMSTVDYNNAPQETKYQYIHDFKHNIGRDIDMAQDYAQLQHITAYVNGYTSPNDGEGYAAGASFIDYLISRFGEETVIEIICKTHDFGEFTYEQLVADWNTFLQENYSGYQTIR